ncbi:hypothetical protein EVAR_12930_1 [Eumeta japonica]|uniref:Uncharacterized protein n=1 Tax=Eumeta variegata TaxID=151549 RepID=A0A4C1TVV4_EUMVA|nr:hypothetical protein EVAR_12930_1 [Eumeta japonica]
MSIPHALAPVRLGSVGLKPTKKVPLKVKSVGRVKRSRATSRTTMIASSSAAGRTAVFYGRLLKVSSRRETVTGRCPGKPEEPGFVRNILRVVDVVKTFNYCCKSVRWIIQYVPWPTDKIRGRRRFVVDRRVKERIGM